MKRVTVLGSPGTGKTRKLVSLVKEAESIGYKGSDIQIISHTKAAAQEISSRAGSKVNASTIHSLAFQIAKIVAAQVVTNKMLKDFGNEIDVPIRGMGDLDSFDSLNEGDEYLAIYNYARNIQGSPTDVYNKSHRPGKFEMYQYFCKSYENWKGAYGLIDFTDMLQVGIDALDKNHGIKVLFIDEAQDLSYLQWLFVHTLINCGLHEITIAGDPDQALYVWGGANPQGMADFIDTYDSEIITLEQSYRVPKGVHKVGQSIIKRIDNRIEKTYLPRDEAGGVEEYGHVSYIDFDSPEDTLILFRNHSMRRDIERELINNAVPYATIGGFQGLHQNKYAQAIRSLLKLKNNEPITEMEIRRMGDVAFKDFKKEIYDKKFDRVLGLRPSVVLDVPHFMHDYYGRVDLTKQPNIRLSTIHGSKGREADHIILFTGMTNRTLDEMSENPDNEHRVWYVAVTRAKKRLTIIHGDNGYNVPT